MLRVSLAGNVMNVTYKNLRLFVEQQDEGWLAYVCDLDRLQFVYEGRRLHLTVAAAQREAQAKADEILGETIEIDWCADRVMTAHG